MNLYSSLTVVFKASITVLPVIYELDNPNEWQDETKWYKANPRTWNNKKY